MTDGGDTCANGTNRKVQQYSLDGKFLASFNAIRLAARETGIDHATIGRCCNREISHAGGFIWVYEGEEPIIPKKPLLIKKVGQYSLDTKELIAIYKNAVEAARAIGKNNPSNIRNVCRGEQKFAYGYFWKYLE